MQSDSIILILYVDDKNKPQTGLLKASRPPPGVPIPQEILAPKFSEIYGDFYL